MLEDLRAQLTESVRLAARERLGVEVERVVLERPPKLALGDLACPVAFDLARPLRKAPRAIAAELAGALALPAGVREARVEGAGYLNFFLERGPIVRALLAGPEAPAAAAGKIVVEHTNINPNKAAHIGHLRNAVLGDVLVRVLRHLGHAVEVQNYLDDTGVQVADVVAGLVHLQNVASVFPLHWLVQGMQSVFLPESFAAITPTGTWQHPMILLVTSIWLVAGLVAARLSFRWIRKDA